MFESSRSQPEVTGDQFIIEFEITDPLFKQPTHPTSMYTVKVKTILIIVRERSGSVVECLTQD